MSKAEYYKKIVEYDGYIEIIAMAMLCLFLAIVTTIFSFVKSWNFGYEFVLIFEGFTMLLLIMRIGLTHKVKWEKIK